MYLGMQLRNDSGSLLLNERSGSPESPTESINCYNPHCFQCEDMNVFGGRVLERPPLHKVRCYGH